MSTADDQSRLTAIVAILREHVDEHAEHATAVDGVKAIADGIVVSRRESGIVQDQLRTLQRDLYAANIALAKVLAVQVSDDPTAKEIRDRFIAAADALGLKLYDPKLCQLMPRDKDVGKAAGFK